MNLKLLATSLLTGAIAATAPATAADYMTAQPPAAAYVQQPTICSDNGVLGTIDRRFDYTDRHLLHAGLDVVDFYNMRLTYWRPSDETHLIERHYCVANVIMNDNQPRTVYYLIEGTMGFAGIGDNVEYCIDGLDPWHVYGAHCNSVRTPFR
jgi:hypothetical protein